MPVYEEVLDTPCVYELFIKELVNGIVIYCSYEIGITIVTEKDKVHLFCLNRKEAGPDLQIEYDKIFDYIYNKIKSNEPIKSTEIQELTTSSMGSSVDELRKFCPFNQ